MSCILIAVSDGGASLSADVPRSARPSAKRNVRPTPNVGLRLVHGTSATSSRRHTPLRCRELPSETLVAIRENGFREVSGSFECGAVKFFPTGALSDTGQ